MRQIFQTMGTVASLDIAGCDEVEVFKKVFTQLAAIDGRFSPYKKASEVSRYNTGKLPHSSQEFKQVMSACKQWEGRTNGFFSAWYKGAYDPSGYVKGWAIEEGARLIKKLGYNTFCLSIGGDMVASGSKAWSIGIQHPTDTTKILNKLSIYNKAVATSGTYERGQHIVNPKTGEPTSYWLSLTAVGPSIITADVLATACFAAGAEAQEIMAKFPDYELSALRQS